MTLDSIYKKGVLELKEALIPSPELDTKVLLEFVTGKDRTSILSHPGKELSKSQNEKFKKLIKKRQKGVPIAYIVGHKEFFGYDFIVNKNTLIPRPESEFLVEEAIRIINQKILIKNHADRSGAKIQRLKILDMGTGSGCLIISLHNKLRTLYKTSIIFNFVASDISPKALNVARKNAETHGAKGKIKFFLSDLFSNSRLHTKYDLVIANLPYVPKDIPPLSPPSLGGGSFISPPETGGARGGMTDNDSIKFEPPSAIFANDNGASIIKKFLDQVGNYLASIGTILIELDPRNAQEIKNYAKKIFKNVVLTKDLAGLGRYLVLNQ